MAATVLPSDWRRFAMFIGAGIVNTCFGYTAFAFFIWVGLGNDLAVLFGMTAGIAFNFGTIGAVFSSRGFSRLPHFLAVYSALLFTNIMMLRSLVAAGTGPYLGEAIIIALLTPISFVAMRRLVFVPAPEQVP